MAGSQPSAQDLNSLNYAVLDPYNGTIETGGNSLTQDLNVFYEVSLVAAFAGHLLTSTSSRGT